MRHRNPKIRTSAASPLRTFRCFARRSAQQAVRSNSGPPLKTDRGSYGQTSMASSDFDCATGGLWLCAGSHSPSPPAPPQASPSVARACSPSGSRSAAPLKSTQLDVKISDQVAETHVVQIFANDFAFPLEGTYIFPMPAGAALKEFAIWENGKKLKGEVLAKEEARKIYLDILRKWRDPGPARIYGGRHSPGPDLPDSGTFRKESRAELHSRRFPGTTSSSATSIL